MRNSRIGTLMRISGQVVRTHPVHPELVSGTFLCVDCQTVIKDVEQQFKYMQASFHLHVSKKFRTSPFLSKYLLKIILIAYCSFLMQSIIDLMQSVIVLFLCSF